MTDKSWTVIPLRARYTALVLWVEHRKDGSKRLLLHIPLHLRQRSEYFTNCRLIHCKILERENLIMIQFVPEEVVDKKTRKIWHGQLYLARDILCIPIPDTRHRIKIPYKLEGSNIVIDRETLKHIKALEEVS